MSTDRTNVDQPAQPEASTAGLWRVTAAITAVATLLLIVATAPPGSVFWTVIGNAQTMWDGLTDAITHL